MLSSDEEIPLQEHSARYVVEYKYSTTNNNRLIFSKLIIDKRHEKKHLKNLTTCNKKMTEETISKFKVLKKKFGVEKNDPNTSSSSSDENSQKSGRKNRRKILNTSSNRLNIDSISDLLYEVESDDESDECFSDYEIDDAVIKEAPKNCAKIAHKRRSLKSKSKSVISQDVPIKQKVKQKGSEVPNDSKKTKRDLCDNGSSDFGFSTPSKRAQYCKETLTPVRSSQKDGNKNESVDKLSHSSKSHHLNSSRAICIKDQENPRTPERKPYSVQSLKKITSPSTRKNEQKNSADFPEDSNKPKQALGDNDSSDTGFSTPNKSTRYSRKTSRTPLRSSEEVIRKESGDELTNSSKSLCAKAIYDKEQENPCTPDRKPYSIQSLKKIATPTTPSTRKGTPKRLHLTPSMPVCKRNIGTPSTPLQDAMTRLHVSAVPCSLPCREDEFRNIFNFLEGKLLDGAGGCMYISGVPGTGKTATVRETVKSLQKLVQDDELSDFQFIEINGMRLSHPRQAYVQLWKSLTGEVVTPEQAQRLLDDKFTHFSKKISSIVLLVDEVDVLWTRRQDVVYNLLDWPTKSKSRLVVVTIANTMDLPERLLMGRVTSRLGLTRLTFQPYTHKQLEKIVKARLEGLNAFDADAIQFVSRKVASLSGDARRALDICRRATEIAEQESPQNLVTIKHVDEAMLSMTSSRTVQAIMHACSTIEQMFLQAVEADLARTGMEETTFCKAYSMMETLCSLEGFSLPTPRKAMSACMNLSSLRLLLSQHSHMDIYTRIFLNISVDDLHYALQEIRKDKNNKK